MIREPVCASVLLQLPTTDRNGTPGEAPGRDIPRNMPPSSWVLPRITGRYCDDADLLLLDQVSSAPQIHTT